MWRPLRRASVFLRQRAREWTVTGFLMISPSFTNFRICCPEAEERQRSEARGRPRAATKQEAATAAAAAWGRTHASWRWRSRWFHSDPARPSSSHSARRWTPSASGAWACFKKEKRESKNNNEVKMVWIKTYFKFDIMKLKSKSPINKFNAKREQTNNIVQTLQRHQTIPMT